MCSFQASLTLDESNLNASSLGDISTDDNAVDLPIKSEEEQTVTGLSTNSNERIPILDDDDDVIVLPQEEPVITEIPDDDDHEPKQTNVTKDGSNIEGEALVASGILSQDTGISTQPDEKKDQTNTEGSLYKILNFTCKILHVICGLIYNFFFCLNHIQQMTTMRANTMNLTCKFWSHKFQF